MQQTQCQQMIFIFFFGTPLPEIDKLFVHGWRSGHSVANRRVLLNFGAKPAKPGSEVREANNLFGQVGCQCLRVFFRFVLLFFTSIHCQGN